MEEKVISAGGGGDNVPPKGEDGLGGVGESPPGAGLPQEQPGLFVVVAGQAVKLSPLDISDFPLIRVILSGQPTLPTEYQAMAMDKLVKTVIRRSPVTEEQLAAMKVDPISTFLAVSAAIEQSLVSKIG